MRISTLRISTFQPADTGLTQMLRRRRSGCALASSNTPQLPTIVSTTHTPSSMPVILNVPVPITPGVSHRIRLVPHLDSRRSLRFDPITRDVVEGDPALRIGRFTERSGVPISQANALNSYKDTKNSSGTFLVHVRLSVVC
ncbi:hypothetical protein BGY98DRAFT_303461 [Russula aff. rugulosa BPL654]|nr:hypothetical protein BGY98DRAFT_303461 [Russula aff. rugulosa BPL654]